MANINYNYNLPCVNCSGSGEIIRPDIDLGGCFESIVTQNSDTIVFYGSGSRCYPLRAEFTGSFDTSSINNVFLSQSKYLLTSSFNTFSSSLNNVFYSINNPAGYVDKNIYSANGTLSDSRIVDFSNFGMVFTNVKSFNIGDSNYGSTPDRGYLGCDFDNKAKAWVGDHGGRGNSTYILVTDNDGTITLQNVLNPTGSYFKIANYSVRNVGDTLAIADTSNGMVEWVTPFSTASFNNYTASLTMPLSRVTAATSSNSINNFNYRQTWRWDSLSSGSGFTLASTSSLASGSLAKLFEVFISGSNTLSGQTTYAAYISNLKSGSTSTNIGLNVAASGATTNWAINADRDIKIEPSTAGTARLRLVSSANPSFYGEITIDNGANYIFDSTVDAIYRRSGTNIWTYGSSLFQITSTNVDFKVRGSTDNLLYVDASVPGIGILTNLPTGALDINSDSIRIRTAKTPSSATDTGVTGQIAWDTNFIYVCVATNTWKRTAVSTW